MLPDPYTGECFVSAGLLVSATAVLQDTPLHAAVCVQSLVQDPVFGECLQSKLRCCSCKAPATCCSASPTCQDCSTFGTDCMCGSPLTLPPEPAWGVGYHPWLWRQPLRSCWHRQDRVCESPRTSPWQTGNLLSVPCCCLLSACMSW